MKFTCIATLTLAVLTSHAAVAELADLSIYNNIYYVDVNGDNTNTGSADNPFATVKQAVSAASDGDAVYVNPGAHDITRVTDKSSSYGVYTGLNNGGKNIDFIGVGGETILYIDGANSNARDMHMFSGYSGSSDAYSQIFGMTFVRYTDDRNKNYSTAFFGALGGNINAAFYNTVFKSSGDSAPSLTYANKWDINVTIENSSFDLDYAFRSSYSGLTDDLVISNSAVNTAFYTSQSGIYEDNITGVMFDDTYNITSVDGGNNTAGVYSGDGGWGSVASVNSPFAAGGLAALVGLGFGAFRRKKKS